jgi:hypothetical protein
MTLEDDLREVPRDQWQRPMILQPGEVFKKDCKAGKKGDPLLVGYTRVSSLAKVLDDGVGLSKWSDAMTAIGVALDPDILGQVYMLCQGSANPYAEHSSALIKLATAAQEAAGSTVKRDLGSELHQWAQRWDTGQGLAGMPPELLDDVHAYVWGTSELTMLDRELFVVVDELQAAGTLDALCVTPDLRVVVADQKTGQRDCDYPMTVEMQVAIYAHGKRYNFQTGERNELHDPIDLTRGLLIHTPSGSGRCDLYELDLQRGWDNARAAVDLKERRKRSNRKLKPLTEWGNK